MKNIIIIAVAVFCFGCARFYVKTPTYTASATTVSKDIHVKIDTDTNGIIHAEYDSTVNGVAIGEAAGAAGKALIK